MKKCCTTNRQGKCKSTTMRYHLTSVYELKGRKTNVVEVMKKLQYWHTAVREWRRQWHPTPVLLPGKSHGRRSPVGCSPWGRKELDSTERLHFHLSTFMHWRRKWQPTPVSLPEESQGRRSLVGCHLWGRTESDTTEVTQQQQQLLERMQSGAQQLL